MRILYLAIGLLGNSSFAQTDRTRSLSSASSCRVDLVGVQYEDHTHTHRLDCADADGIPGLSFQMKNMDKALTKQMEKDILAGEEVYIEIQGGANVQKGAKMDVTGKKISKKKKKDYRHETNQSRALGSSEVQMDAVSRHRSLAITGVRTVLVLRISAPDGSVSNSAGVLSRRIFGGYDDDVNLKSQYDDCSHGQLDFIPAQGTGIVNGVAEVSISSDVIGADDGDVVNDATNAANAANLNLSSYDHVMYCLPPGTNGNWIGYASLPGWRSVYNNDWCSSVSLQLHEIGHNLGLHHSNEGVTAYADQSGMMGYSYSNHESPKMCFNAAKSWQLGWFTNGYTTHSPMLVTSGQFRLVGPTDYTQDNFDHTIVLRIPRSGEDLFLMYNRLEGFNSGSQEGGNRVLINSQGNGFAESNLEAKLSSGEVKTFTNFENSGKDLIIMVVATGTGDVDYADVLVSLGSCADDNDCNDGNTCNGNETCDIGGFCIGGDPLVGCCGNGVCESGEDSVSCASDCLAGPYVVSTDLCSSCFINQANMFNVEAKENIVVTSLSIYTYESGTYTAYIYTKAGSYSGYENNADAWTLLGSHTFSTNGWKTISIPETAMSSVSIPANSYQAFYVMLDGGKRLLFAQGTGTPGTLVKESDELNIYEGRAGQNNFGSSGFGWVWNGDISFYKTIEVTTNNPTKSPTVSPTTSSPTKAPTKTPTKAPMTLAPTKSPTLSPSRVPTKSPTASPTVSPTTSKPSIAPTKASSQSPTRPPIKVPTESPTTSPTVPPTTSSPTKAPTKTPTKVPTESPTTSPTVSPTTSSPTKAPTKTPTKAPTKTPTTSPTVSPTTSSPTKLPSMSPTKVPSKSPTKVPTNTPTTSPTKTPTASTTFADFKAKNNFENGWGDFLAGGGDAKRFTKSSDFKKGEASLEIRDNSGSESSVYTKNLLEEYSDLRSYDKLSVQFWFCIKSFEKTENWFLEYSTDGLTYIVVKNFVNGVDFVNDDNGYLRLDLKSKSGMWPDLNSSPEFRVRFRCNASDNKDKLYIDDVELMPGPVSAAAATADAKGAATEMCTLPGGDCISSDECCSKQCIGSGSCK